MKKNFLLPGIFLIIISACRFLPISFPTSTTPYPTVTKPAVAEATETLAITLTPIPIITKTPIPTPLPLTIQSGSPAYIQNFAHLDAGCNWIGVAGQIFDTDRNTIKNLVVNVQGDFGQTRIDEIGLTGVPEADVYGPGGYEIKIADQTFDTINRLRVQVLDLQGNNLSDELLFSTFSDCKKNLIIINFITK